MITFHRIPLPSHQCALPGMDQTITFQSPCAAASAEPHKPPTSACEELEGRPNHQVSKFHRIAPTKAQTRISEVTIRVSTKPEAIVLATAVPHKAPSRLVKAARITA